MSIKYVRKMQAKHLAKKIHMDLVDIGWAINEHAELFYMKQTGDQTHTSVFHSAEKEQASQRGRERIGAGRQTVRTVHIANILVSVSRNLLSSNAS
jgi:hypothetical protein